MIAENNISNYMDFAGLANLKGRAAEGDPESLAEAARQFEALFMQMMLKSMRDASSVFGESGDQSYQQMFDQQIAIELSEHKGLGIADLLLRQLSPSQSPAEDSDASSTTGTATSPAPALAPPLRPLAEQDYVARSTFIAATATATSIEPPQSTERLGPRRDDWRPRDPEDFIRDIWPLANRVAEQLHLDPKAVVAQAALETGWGQKLIRDDAGVSGNNVFGIKADGRWDGDRVRVSTLEYEGAGPVRQSAEFRAYESLDAGFDDYVNFLRTNPRYQTALAAGARGEDFGQSLQDAGYATDPGYASKLRAIIAGPLLNRAIDAIEKGAQALAGYAGQRLNSAAGF